MDQFTTIRVSTSHAGLKETAMSCAEKEGDWGGKLGGGESSLGEEKLN